MAETSSIEWTDATWNPVTGCSVVSPGCTNCYAMRLAGTRLQDHPSRVGLTTPSKAGPVWNGQVRLNEDWLTLPLHWKRPRRIFVCAHGDLFHEAVPDAWIDQVMAVANLARQHTYQILTKRSARMRKYFNDDALTPRVLEAAQRIDPQQESAAWPTPRVWIGVSVEDQPRADERLVDLLQTRAAIRFVSAEPLLGAIYASWALSRNPIEIALGFLRRGHFSPGLETLRPLDWVIAGGESGPGARPMHPDWPRLLRDDCAASNIPFFFKQWGEWLPEDHGQPDLRYVRALQTWDRPPASQLVGKKRAGRLLDGVEHNAMPEVR